MKRGVVIFLLLVLVGSVSAQIFLGTIDGFVTFSVNGTNASNANVTVSIDGKSGAGSSGNTLTGSNGYYAITNLNFNQGDTATVNANISNRIDQESGTANAFQTAQVNLSLAAVPFPPTLTNINDTHNNSIIFFDWINGTDPDGLPTFNRFTLDGTTFNNTDPVQNRTFLSFAFHTWSVVTCNVVGCSTADSDTFEIFNDPPPSPILEAEPDTSQTNVTLNWTSGGADPENDTTFFQFQIDSQPLLTNVTPTITISGLSFGSHTWRVRECDPIECSSFSSDVFQVTNNPPTTPNLTPTDDNFDDSNSFTFTTGQDPENTTVINEFQFNSTSLISNVTSPQTVNVSGIIDNLTVRVRSCDLFGACSSFATDSYIHFVCPPPPAQL